MGGRDVRIELPSIYIVLQTNKLPMNLPFSLSSDISSVGSVMISKQASLPLDPGDADSEFIRVQEMWMELTQ